MDILSRKEELILLAVWKLQDNAYGVTIRDHIKVQTGISIKFGAIYAPLARLVRFEFVESYDSEPLPERGGRSKIIYKLTEKGISALKRIQEVNAAMWAGLPNLTGEV
jgi:DNA-binding PadR family transcriptional regulator